MSCNRKPALPSVSCRTPSTTPSTSSSHDSSSASLDPRRAVTVEGDRAVFSKIMQIATSAVRFLWMAEGVTSVDDLTCLYTSLVSFAIEHSWGRRHRSVVQESTHSSESGSPSLPCLRGDQCRGQRSLWPAPRPDLVCLRYRCASGFRAGPECLETL